MAKQYYFPTQDEQLVPFLNNFAQKFETHAPVLGYTAADVQQAKDDAAVFAYMMSLVNLFTTEKEERIDFKNLLRNGPEGSPIGPLPDMPAIPAPPSVTFAPGIMPRMRKLIKNIKSNRKYTNSMGSDMGIIGAEDEFDPNTLKPVIKLVFKGGQVEVQWSKGNAHAIRIEKAVGTGAFAFLAVDTEPHYIDTTALPATPAVWKYRAIYLISDKPVGQMSDVISITVGG